MSSPRLYDEDSLHRAIRKKLWIQEGAVTWLAFERRGPSLKQDGTLQSGDAKGLSIGFAETESEADFISRTQQFLSFYGVVSVLIGTVRGIGLDVEREEYNGMPSDVKGNITDMPFSEATDQMDKEQLTKVDPIRAEELGSFLANNLTSTTFGAYKKL